MNTAIAKLNWPVLGNTHIVDFLAKNLAKNSIAGAYIFAGPEKLGKNTIASFFAYSLLCEKRDTGVALPCGECASCRQHLSAEVVKDEESLASVHPDFHLLQRDKDKKNISIEQVRDFIRTLGMSSFLNSYKIGIIKHAESLSEDAANALLKTLEEPKDKVVVILLVSNIESLPATIASRAQVLNFRPVKSDVIYEYLIKEHGVNRSQAISLARLSLGRPALAVKFLEDKDFFSRYEKRVKVFLDFFRVDLSVRYAAIAEILGDKASGQEATKIAKKILEAWQGVVRDLFLLSYGQEDLIQHELVMSELNEQRAKINLPLLLKLSAELTQAENYLKANVNPKAVLESVAMQV